MTLETLKVVNLPDIYVSEKVDESCPFFLHTLPKAEV